MPSVASQSREGSHVPGDPVQPSLLHIKRQVYRDLIQPFDAAITETQRLMDETVAGPDFKEGISAFLDRRPPRFSRIS